MKYKSVNLRHSLQSKLLNLILLKKKVESNVIEQFRFGMQYFLITLNLEIPALEKCEL